MNSSVTKSLAVLVAACLGMASVNAQTPGSNHPMNTATATDVSAQDTAGLRQEVARLREQVQALEQRLQQTVPSTPAQSGAMKMNMHGGHSKQMSTGPQSAKSKGNMPMMEDDMPTSSPAPGASMPAAAGGRMGMKMMDMRMQDDDGSSSSNRRLLAIALEHRSIDNACKRSSDQWSEPEQPELFNRPIAHEECRPGATRRIH